MEGTVEVRSAALVTVPTVQALYWARDVQVPQADADGQECVPFPKQAPQSQLLAQHSVFLNTALHEKAVTFLASASTPVLCRNALFFRKSPASGCSNPNQAIFCTSVTKQSHFIHWHVDARVCVLLLH